MASIAAFACIFRLSRFFGIFPFGIREQNGVHIAVESRKVVNYTKFATFAFGVAGCYYISTQTYVSFNLAPQRSSRVVWVSSNISLVFSGFMVLRPILKHRTAFHYWLNKIPDVFSYLKENSLRKIVAVYYCTFAILVILLIAAVTLELEAFQQFHQDWLLLTFYMTIFSFYILSFEVKIFLQLFCVFVNLIRFYYSDTRELLRSGEMTQNKQTWLRFLRKFRLKDMDVKDFMDFLHLFFLPVVSLQIICGFFNFLLHVSMITKGIGPPGSVQLFWAVYVFWDTFLIAAFCQVAENEGERTIHYLHESLIQWDDKELKKEIELLSLQLQHRRLEFSALGCQRLNFSLIYWMVGLLASYAVVMAQFHIESTAVYANIMRNSSQL